MLDVVQQNLFDYASLDADTREFVQEKAQSIHARLKRTTEDIIAIGQDLIEVNDKLTPHGKFSAWLRAEFDMNRRTAYRFINVAKKFGSCDIMSQLPPTALYHLLDTPDTVIEMVETGQIPATIPAIREARQAEKPIEGETETITATQFIEEIQTTAPNTPLHLPSSEPIAIPESWKLSPEMRVEAPVKSSTLTALQSSDSNEWFTPAEYVNAARELMGGIDVDPASNEQVNSTVIHATRIYDISTNGLNKDWIGRAWLNPPYGFEDGKSNQERWVNKLLEQYPDITTEAVLLVNANTEAKWFQPLYEFLICFTNHRIKFYNTSGGSSQPTQGNALVYFGKNEARFIEIFSQFGVVVRRADGR